ncbi:hypothetical protein CYMTET_54849 [Cymbomonas tetramitiformis]|uniref:Uncharacterized protein n=1 Tax=Cymbomonas tetramitiformis TaxID=36881 RepID=A0AAE0ENC0_9CHLO|nr:hypothetical protein CYMTET_54849 [Cymbomonas tetramitiformis]
MAKKMAKEKEEGGRKPKKASLANKATAARSSEEDVHTQTEAELAEQQALEAVASFTRQKLQSRAEAAGNPASDEDLWKKKKKLGARRRKKEQSTISVSGMQEGFEVVPLEGTSSTSRTVSRGVTFLKEKLQGANVKRSIDMIATQKSSKRMRRQPNLYFVSKE